MVRTGTARLLHKPPDTANCPTNDASDLVVDDPGNQDEQNRDDQEEAARAGWADDGQGDRADQQQERAQDDEDGNFEQALGLGIPWSQNRGSRRRSERPYPLAAGIVDMSLLEPRAGPALAAGPAGPPRIDDSPDLSPGHCHSLYRNGCSRR